MCWGVLQGVAVCCSVLQCVAICCDEPLRGSMHLGRHYPKLACYIIYNRKLLWKHEWTPLPDAVLQCDAVCRSMSQSVAGRCRTLQGVAVCCSVLQRVAVCCSTLQRVAEYCSARSRHSSCGSHLFGNHVLLFPRLFSYYPSRAYSTITLPETIQVLLASLQCPGGFN